MEKSKRKLKDAFNESLTLALLDYTSDFGSSCSKIEPKTAGEKLKYIDITRLVN